MFIWMSVFSVTSKEHAEEKREIKDSKPVYKLKVVSCKTKADCKPNDMAKSCIKWVDVALSMRIALCFGNVLTEIISRNQYLDITSV